jgi:hypothetical protein
MAKKLECFRAAEKLMKKERMVHGGCPKIVSQVSEEQPIYYTNTVVCITRV